MANFPGLDTSTPAAGGSMTQIWRIEGLEPAAVAKEDYGKFYDGDAYIVFHVKVSERNAKTSSIFFWLGSECSIDERGAAAYQTVALDDHLGGEPVQYREVAGSESSEFLSIFPSLTVLKGGIASAFNHVEKDAYEPRLLHLKGKRHVRVAQCELKAPAPNEGDVFILDLGLTLVQWNGKEANRYEKAKALDVVTSIRNERGARPEVRVLSSGDNDDDAQFWSTLGGSSADVKSAAEGGDDSHASSSAGGAARLVDASGAVLGEGALDRALLDTATIRILHAGSVVFVWQGKGAPADEKKKGMAPGLSYLDANGLPQTTQVVIVKEGAENALFKSNFGQWEPPRQISFASPAEKKAALEAADANSMAQRREQAEAKMVDDAAGKVEVWRIEDFEKQPVPESQYGQFFAGDSYIVKYTYLKSGRECYILYFWQGRDSSSDEKAASALLTVQMDDELGGAATQVRLTQGKEVGHFYQIFNAYGGMIVHSGGRASAFKNRADTDSYDTDGTALYHVRGTNDHNTHAVAVPEVAGSLNSGDVFVLLTPGTMYTWNGQGASDDERKIGASVADRLANDRAKVEVAEGEEPDAFWDALGGKGEYTTSETLRTGAAEPRLFQLSDMTGTFKAEEIFNFTQEDLCQDDVMLLDAGEELLIWVGHGSTHEERQLSIKTAFDYLKATDRSPETPVWQVAAGTETPNFTCHFHAWDDAMASDFEDPYAAKMAKMGIKEGGAAGGSAAGAGEEMKRQPSATRLTAAAAEGDGYDYSTKYSLADLQNNNIPASVNKAKKECYLSDEDFKTHLGCTPDEFKEMKKWKQDGAKKKAGIF